MTTHRSTLIILRLVILVCQLGLILRTDAQMPDSCITSDTNRPPDNSDITVVCGTNSMDLSIYICPMYNALYNESLMVLNNQYNKPECFGRADWTATPPVLKFRFPINESALSSCANNFRITDEVGSGVFADSSIQFVNISGSVTSINPSVGVINYRPQISYRFSCRYPLQYVLNSTEVSVSGVNSAINDMNSSFINALSMRLYQDVEHKEVLTIPQTGLSLHTRIYVAVTATNLTDSFYVLLDRCYSTPTPQPFYDNYYDLFVGCSHNAQTKVELNGVSQEAHFSFETFRFVEHNNLTVSTFYVHCATTLCEESTCSMLLPNCEKQQWGARTEKSDSTVTSPAIMVANKSADVPFDTIAGVSPLSCYSVMAVIIYHVMLMVWLSI
ncbi:zona pellucida-like domain-containing protein 1 [Parambassis ranga]|uniref:Zona pellucida-like domain-containing protein 1 n=1 Tax=Parambassis ranga TaxID=210632 RepID=A0A6P7JJW5_9TELE|nr:zona pellucida-like domain-containing protein 1 [Parambassis ranga]